MYDIILTEMQLKQVVERLASEVAADLGGKPLIITGVLKGCIHFTSDLSRALSNLGVEPRKHVPQRGLGLQGPPSGVQKVSPKQGPAGRHVVFLTRYDGELRGPFLQHQGSQVSMPVVRGSG